MHEVVGNISYPLILVMAIKAHVKLFKTSRKRISEQGTELLRTKPLQHDPELRRNHGKEL